jgi:hypothetical protein
MTPKDFKTSSGKWAMTVQINGVQKHTKSRTVWRDMISRCTENNPIQKSFPGYIGCTVAEEFKDFQFFAEWCNAQIGYGLENYQIDKDILYPNNKVYSSKTCVFVPRALNSFLCAANKIRGIYPQGVSVDKRRNRFIAYIYINNSRKNLGYFETDELAAATYKNEKEKEAKRWASRIESHEFIVDPRVTERLKKWRLEDYHD